MVKRKEGIMEVLHKINSVQQAPMSGLAKFVIHLSKVIDPLVNIVGVTIACISLAAMMFLTFFDVAGRHMLNKPIVGSLEIIEFLMVLLVTFGLGYCALKNGHIRVDVIMQFTTRKVNLWFDIFAYCISCIFYIFITWRVWLYGISIYKGNLTSPTLLIPVYPFVFLLSVGAAFVALVFLREFLKSIDEVSN